MAADAQKTGRIDLEMIAESEIGATTRIGRTHGANTRTNGHVLRRITWMMQMVVTRVAMSWSVIGKKDNVPRAMISVGGPLETICVVTTFVVVTLVAIIINRRSRA